METSQAQGGTRSGLLWEVERILNELYDTHTHSLPQVLLLENVPECIGSGNVQHFNKWLDKLESLGYTNHFQILNAKDYGIPQNRRRVFMVSILGDYAYDFPLKIKLKYRLKDFLEKKVDEKYYLSEKMIQYITTTGTKDFSVNNAKINCEQARPLTTEQNKRAGTTNYVCNDLPDNFDLSEKSDEIEHIANLNYYNHEQSDRVFGAQGCAPTLRTGHDEAKAIKILEESRERENGIMVKENNSKGYKVAKSGDGVNLASRMKHQRGNVQNGSIQTLKAQMEIGVVVEDEKPKS